MMKLILLLLLEIVFVFQALVNTATACDNTPVAAKTTQAQIQVASSHLRSKKVMKQAQVELGIFSGRKDPSWSLSETDTETLIKMIHSLPITPAVEFKEDLGYRGFLVNLPKSLSDSIKDLKVYDGVIRYDSEGQTKFVRDIDKRVERWLLTSGKSHIQPEIYKTVETQINSSR